MLGSVQSVKISIFVARIIATQNTLRHQEEPAAILGTTAFSCLLLYEVILGLWYILQILSTLCFNRKTQCICQLYCCHSQFLFFSHPVLLSLGFFFFSPVYFIFFQFFGTRKICQWGWSQTEREKLGGREREGSQDIEQEN